MHRVESSNVDRMGYDPDARELVVEFKNGGRYVYFEVPPAVYGALEQAPSVGRYLANSVQPNYESRKQEVRDG